MSRALSVGFALLLGVAPSVAQEPRPLEIRLDATEVPRKLLKARLLIPVTPGPLTLAYPKWIPGEHSPSGPINDLSGLKLSAGGKSLTWRRDDVHLYSFHCTVPDGVSTIEAELEYLAPQAKDAEGYSAGTSMTAKLAILNWNLVLIYPQGQAPEKQHVRAHIKVPSGWRLGTALPVEWNKGDEAQSKEVSLAMLIDSPVLCGAHFKEVPIGPADGPPHFLVLACDSAAGLNISDALKRQYDRLVEEAGALFGARHYRSYKFLVALSDHIRTDAIEHHESSDNRMPERFFVDDEYRKHSGAWILPHEYVHSWNGKYRRPEGLMIADFQKPMKTRELWVYEGLTQYLGFVLTGRSGLYTPEVMRENYAVIADWARQQKGRTWRPLEDTTASAPRLYYARTDWGSRRRGVDFYDEGALLWLDVDTLIREKTKGKKSLDDFCRAFFGGKGGMPEVKPYTIGELVDTLNAVLAYDWKEFLDKRLTSTSPEPPLDGLSRGGWKLTYREAAGDFLQARDNDEKALTLISSIGLKLSDTGQVIDVIPGTAADKAGIGPAMKIVAVNERRFSPERLKQAVAATASGKERLSFLFENNDYIRGVTLEYAGGARYPYLERDAAKTDVFSEIFGPRK